MPVDHYENFPVASFLMPPALRHPVSIVYRFARTADDHADEGRIAADKRLEALNAMAEQLRCIADDRAPLPVPDPQLYVELAKIVREHQLDLQPFHDLLSAFTQDVTVKRYETYPELLDYCTRSANPVGRIMLRLYGQDTAENRDFSDSICTALQLINFWQDIAIDRWIGRIYVPLEDLRQFNVTVAALLRGEARGTWHGLMQFEIRRTRALMKQGAPLALKLPGRIGWELRCVIQGGLRILELIENSEHDVFRRRPKLAWRDWLIVGWRALTMRP